MRSDVPAASKAESLYGAPAAVGRGGLPAESSTLDAEASADARWLADSLPELLVVQLLGGLVGEVDGELVGMAVAIGIEGDLLEDSAGEVVPSIGDVWFRRSRPMLAFELALGSGGEVVVAEPAVEVELLGQLVEPADDRSGSVGELVEGPLRCQESWPDLGALIDERGSLLTATLRADRRGCRGDRRGGRR